MSKPRRINDLNTISGLTRQMRAVYRAARQNCPDETVTPQDAKILVDILKIIVAAHRDSELEQRISALESKNAKS